MEDSFSPIPNAFETRQALPRPNWDVITAWVESNVEANGLSETWLGLAKDWLNRLAGALPSGYATYESSDFLMLAADAKTAARLLDWCERARLVILETLDGVTRDEGHGKHVVLLFKDTDTYYDYITDFYPEEGEFGLSGGIFLSEGYGHFAVCPAYRDEYERIIAHELNHALLRHLPLPLWLNEGVTQFMEDVVLEASYFTMNREIARQHREYWNDETIHLFWSGESFLAADEGQELSYHLAQILFRNLMADYPKRIKDLLNTANYEDAGNDALIQVCGVSLADRVGDFLGKGNWAPRSDYVSVPTSAQAANQSHEFAFGAN